jgi:DNA-directed RNA polymerase alpha subunit
MLLRTLRRQQLRRKALKLDLRDFFSQNRVTFYTSNAIHHLNKAGIHTVKELVEKTDKEILDLPKIGQSTVGYIHSCLGRVGLGFKNV